MCASALLRDALRISGQVFTYCRLKISMSRSLRRREGRAIARLPPLCGGQVRIRRRSARSHGIALCFSLRCPRCLRGSVCVCGRQSRSQGRVVGTPCARSAGRAPLMFTGGVSDTPSAAEAGVCQDSQVSHRQTISRRSSRYLVPLLGRLEGRTTMSSQPRDMRQSLRVPAREAIGRDNTP